MPEFSVHCLPPPVRHPIHQFLHKAVVAVHHAVQAHPAAAALVCIVSALPAADLIASKVGDPSVAVPITSAVTVPIPHAAPALPVTAASIPALAAPATLVPASPLAPAPEGSPSPTPVPSPLTGPGPIGVTTPPFPGGIGEPATPAGVQTALNVPEPSSISLALAGLGFVGFALWRRKRA